jgi:hypothetical protein
VENQNHEHGGRLQVKIHVLFYADNSWTVSLRQINFGTVKYHVQTYKIFIFIIIFRDKAFKYGDDAKFCGLSWYKRWSTLRTIL